LPIDERKSMAAPSSFVAHEPSGFVRASGCVANSCYKTRHTTTVQKIEYIAKIACARCGLHITIYAALILQARTAISGHA